MKYAIIDTAWGAFGVVGSDAGIAATWLPRAESQTRRALAKAWPDAVESPRFFGRLQDQIVSYFEGAHVTFDVDVDLSRVTPFRRQVLLACKRVPYGETASYADLARAVRSPHAARAVGGAMAHNPLPLIVPCHRILAADGTIGGFSSSQGTGEKQRMLALEGVQWPRASQARRPSGAHRRDSDRAALVAQRGPR